VKPSEAEKLAALWTQAQPIVSAFVRTMIRDRHQADEVVQRTAMAAVRKFHEYTAARPFVAWAIGMARFEVLNFRREHAMDRHLFDEALIEKIAGGFERVAGRAISLRDALEICVEELDGRGRQAVDLVYGQGASTAEAAGRLNMSPGAARMLLCRVRAALRECVQTRLVAEGAD
jgi:RNA polymerase sigma-70 factor (ECF subfamily)